MKPFPFAKSLFARMLALALLPSAAFAGEDKASNVILLTLDGVRWREVFQGVDPGQSLDGDPRVFDFLLRTLSKQGPLLGDRSRGERVHVATPSRNSLPGYQSMMAGEVQPCSSNACGRIRAETFPERLRRELDLAKEQVATIASWEKIPYAVEHEEGATFVNAGDQPMHPGEASELDALNRRQKEDAPPWQGARYDKYTFAHAIRYLKERRPRFMFISLNDSDEWGHKGDYPAYLAALRRQDAWIKELVSALDAMGVYGERTTLIITTDHGRGEGNDWGEHGSGYAGSERTWVYGRSPYSRSRGRRGSAARSAHSDLDIRPTIETIFGLAPIASGNRGRAIRSITGPP